MGNRPRHPNQRSLDAAYYRRKRDGAMVVSVELDRDHELATEVMCGHIAHALRRVAPDVQHLAHPERPIWAPIEVAISALPRPLLRLSSRK